MQGHHASAAASNHKTQLIIISQAQNPQSEWQQQQRLQRHRRWPSGCGATAAGQFVDQRCAGTPIGAPTQAPAGYDRLTFGLHLRQEPLERACCGHSASSVAAGLE